MNVILIWEESCVGRDERKFASLTETAVLLTMRTGGWLKGEGDLNFHS